MPNPLYDRTITVSRPANSPDGYGGPPRLNELPLIQTVGGIQQTTQQSGGAWQFSSTGGAATKIAAAVQLSKRVRGRNPTGLPEDTIMTWFECFLDLFPITDGANAAITLMADDKITDDYGRRFVVVGVYPEDALGTMQLVLEQTKV